MSFKKNHLMMAILIIAILSIFMGASGAQSQNNYISVTEDGAIRFDTTGFRVTEIEVIEEVFTGQFVNQTFYNITDAYGRNAIIAVHHTPITNTSSMEHEFLCTDFYYPPPMWVGNHSGQYFSVRVSETDCEDYFDYDFIMDRMIFIK